MKFINFIKKYIKMAQIVTVKSFSSPYEPNGVLSASHTRYINRDNIEDIIDYTRADQPAIKTMIRVKYASGREIKSGAYFVNDVAATLVTAINT